MNDEVNIRRASLPTNQDYTYGDFYHQIQNLKKSNGEYKLSQDSRDNLKRTTGEIFQQLTFTQETGLVVGKIQSGKTMSFEALTGLARDNGVPLIIILAGVSNILTDQTYERLIKDFDIENNRLWDIQKTKISNPSLFEEMNLSQAHWFDEAAPRKKAHIFVVMKNASHIDQITEICTRLNQINNIKTLIIDDESDQYSVDVARDANQSSRIYSCIKRLRATIPNHSFIQYTATPAANMLVALNDILSPDFAYNIDPGEGYTELQSLFPFKGTARFVEDIKEVESDTDDDSVMPEQLKEALYIFLLSVAEGIPTYANDNRSMLVHPSRLIPEHKKFYDWLMAERRMLVKILEEASHGNKDSSYDVMMESFRLAHDNLSSTVKNLPSLDELMAKMKYVIAEVKIELINSGKHSTAEKIDWKKYYAFIICSGQAVDRGTTVEGLTVTYMPRNAAGSQDTQIQRARFLGYREDYKNFLRIYIDSISKNFYCNYHVAETSIRSLIDEFSGRPFKDAVRQWKLVKGFDSCRKAAIKIGGVSKFKATGKFIAPMQPHNGLQRAEENYQAIDNFISQYSFNDMDEDPWFGTENVRSHSSITIPMKDAYEQLFSRIGFQDPKDARAWADLDILMRHSYFKDESDEVDKRDDFDAMIILMGRSSFNDQQWDRRKRSEKINCEKEKCKGDLENLICNTCGTVHDNSEANLKSILQGPNQKSALLYPGDKEIFSPDQNTFTFQIHMLNVHRRDGTVNENIPLIASKLPEEIWKKFDVQTAAGASEEF